jgi:N4-gp56 family major capsid protein
MALTNFAALTSEELTTWGRDFWSKARNNQFLYQFMGESHNSLIHKVTELTKSKKGARAVLTLVNDLDGDGVAGDRTLEGNEEALTSEEIIIQIDQLRHANRHEGKMADQKSVVTFRKESRDKLAYWMADRSDQMAFLKLAGVDFSMHTNGVARVGSDLVNLEFATNLAPTANRHFNWDDSAGALVAGNTATIAADDTISWEMLIQMRAEAEENYLKPVRMEDGVNVYHVFVTPTTMAHLKRDANFLANLRNAAPRSNKNPLFRGSESYYVDGLAIHSFRHVYNTRGAASGSKWGAGGAVDGAAVLFCGAQALGYADIGMPEWVEKGFDYDNQQGISIGKIMGMVKPQFTSVRGGTLEDFGVYRINVAQ